MRARHALAAAASLTLILATSAGAAVKFYSMDKENGKQPDDVLNVVGFCPPTQTNLRGQVNEGFFSVSDDGLGTVTLDSINITVDGLTNLSASGGQLVPVFGPGAFIFSVGKSTTSINSPAVSNTSGIGAHGPSSTAAGGSAEWGLVTGWQITGFSFCLSSPVEICNDNVSPHGTTVPAGINSVTYDLGTWNFDTVGDMEASPYINATFSEGTTNTLLVLRGAFHGSALPMLPLLGFGALACALLVAGGRTLRGHR